MLSILKSVFTNPKENSVQYIASFQFPDKVKLSLQEKYPHLSSSDIDDVMSALREYFQICQLAGGKTVSMPSQVVDHAWHEFILFTQLYHDFCDNAFGCFLHHTPAEAMKNPVNAQRGIKQLGTYLVGASAWIKNSLINCRFYFPLIKN